MTHTIQELEAALPTLPANKRDFAQSLINQSARGLSDKQMFWVNKLIEDSNKPVPVTPEAVKVGDLAGIMTLFDRARAHLKFPAIVMSVPAASMTVRINVAGLQAKHPGTLNVCSGENPGLGGRRDWFGRVMKDGTYTPSAQAHSAIAERLAAFAADPAGVASEHGRLTGRCCFCNRHLQDERSTAVGYGATCADHYGLPWGAK
jgi:hypothetical protein